MKVSFFEMCQCFAQLVTGAMDVGLYRAERQIQDFGYFLVRATFDMPEENAGAVLGPEGSDGRFDGATQLLGLNRLEWRFLTSSDLERGGLHGLGGFRVRRAVEREGIQLSPAKVIDRRVVPDLEDPGRKLELRPIRVDGIQRFDEGFLRQVFGQLAVAHHVE